MQKTDGTVTWVIRDVKKDGLNIAKNANDILQLAGTTVPKLRSDVDEILTETIPDIQNNLAAITDVTKLEFTLLAGSLTDTTKWKGTGDIQLAQPYTDFKWIEFWMANDGTNAWSHRVMPTWEFKRWIDAGATANKTINIGDNAVYWLLYPPQCTTTLLKISSENSYFIACYGINPKQQ